MKIFCLFLLILLTACSRPQPSTSRISLLLSPNHRSVQFNGLDKLVIGELSRDTNTKVWQSLVPVYAMPADTDLKSYQPIQPGRYEVKDSIITFTPDTPFVKGKTYFVRNYQLDAANHLSDYIRGGAKVGSRKYIDLIFKP
ncbi:hypothetical protein FPZ42_05785 [Mucilaginibacter achroorhodeus]|uniref:Lipoprotein n=1 Tax=Mucilaginibacter achroorhodeus TaxID=2599294 RepID=A0A563UBJ5_9SPHI|nr:hypothetical protein [Mucilaginibacter achroorhodeus]TWR28714.1 hypothetical protein FPZ42_05785 [Mucilaginibacter achroorhodeus]